ncbi:TonB-dependent receptor [Sphingomicrobium aestuariivivum]|uniref:TonB-dependent receptor n=1 Tax=Sphingomicrobium aestuariivivum TaxID=1582356 RepID=UPI001FD67703|nr:TonB-dependent receptor [Sphingomicrobium aestuariivivum]MCJ8190303.1 TonB-dependent receptor [Sphingomicrobium aestuariivivum]
MKKMLLCSSALVAVALPGVASAQSTGSVDFDDDAIVITGTAETDVGGVEIPDTPKAKQVIDDELIQKQRPGQTINDIVNLVPGVSFQNNDPWGSSGGGFTIRGFTSDRISQTLDGIPLNDSGNYALYTNQQVDSEILEEVNVNLGSTDVDSPTASAVGGTINIRTRRPGKEFGVFSTLSYGDVFADGPVWDRSYKRVFGMVDTGDLTGNGLTAFGSASYTTYGVPWNDYGRIRKQQYNARIHQDLGGGDFISLTGHYNQNRNNFAGSVRFSDLTEALENGDKEYRFRADEVDGDCTIPAPVAGEADFYSDRSGCGAEFSRRYNPSNTGNIRGSALFNLTDRLVFSVDPSFQYVKANGGGPEGVNESECYVRANGRFPYCDTTDNGNDAITGVIGGRYYFGRDLNGDGDLLDVVAANDPSQTRTYRYAVVSNLAYEINDDHRVRLAYTFDFADHRQTGQVSLMQNDGEPIDVFSVNEALLTVDGFEINKRNRQSYAILNQVSTEYRGQFLNDDLTVVAGLRLPFFKRKLDNRCYTTTADAGRGFVDCVGFDAGQDVSAYEAANPYTIDPVTGEVTGFAPPTERTLDYDKLLPNVGFTYAFSDFSVFGNYAKGLSVPSTDTLYTALYYPEGTERAEPTPETTDSFDGGLRYQNRKVQAQIAGYFTQYNNRLAVSYDPELDESVTRNLGPVDKYGVDASVAYNVTPNTLVYVYGSINESEIQENVLDGRTCREGDLTDPRYFCEGGLGGTRFLATAGKNEAGAPLWSVGGRLQQRFGAVELGLQAKRTGKRYGNDVNTVEVDPYTVVDLDARIDLGYVGSVFGDAALQFNVTNLFDEGYLGYVSPGLENEPFFIQIGAPRAASATLMLGF